MHFSIDRTVHTTAFDKPVVDHWLERKIVQTAAGSTEKDRSDDRPLQRRARYRLSYIPLPDSLSNVDLWVCACMYRHMDMDNVCLCVYVCVFMVGWMIYILSKKKLSIIQCLQRYSNLERHTCKMMKTL